MSTPATPQDTISTALSGAQGDLLATAGIGLGIGAAVLVLRKGWRLVKGFF